MVLIERIAALLGRLSADIRNKGVGDQGSSAVDSAATGSIRVSSVRTYP